MSNDEKSLILHIDDDEANRYAVNLIMSRSGFRVIEAATAEEGMKMAQQQPDLIILDIRLPDMNGFQVCRKLKADPSLCSIPVLQTSASFISTEDKVEGLDSGADGYLAQPIDASVLVATVKSLLRIRKAEREAQKAIESRQEMLAIVSHDLRNPLTAIMLQVGLLSKNFKNMNEPEFLGKLEKISKAGQRMNSLIQDLLDVSSIDSEKFNILKEPFSAMVLINDALTAFEDMAAADNISIVKKFPEQDVMANGDRTRIQQVMVNLISNAMKFTPAGGTVTLGFEVEDEAVKFFVSDTGVGISPEHLPHIFDRFWQGHKSTRLGVGLGLSIVKGIITAHNGDVEVSSNPGKGTTFCFTLPK